MLGDEGWLDQCVFYCFFEDFQQQFVLVVVVFDLYIQVFGMCGYCGVIVQFFVFDFWVVFEYCVFYGLVMECWVDVDVGVVLVQFGGVDYLFGGVVDQVFGEVYDFVVCGICLIQFEYGEFGVVLG